MTTWTMRIACVLLALAPTAFADKHTRTTAATNHKQPITLTPGDMKWMAAPPQLPKGAQVTVLHGDPTKPGDYTLRFKVPDGYTIPPHWHTKDEELTIMKGTLVLHLGDTMEAERHDLVVGSYHYLPARTHHGAQAKGETIVQVQGPGPFDIHYIDADHPNPKSARR